MDQKMYDLTIASLLHDYGKCLHRSHLDGRAHAISGAERLKNKINNPDIIKAIRFHHRKHLISQQLNDDALAYLVYYADNVSAGTDRREIEGEETKGFKKDQPLASIFNYLKDGPSPGKFMYPPTTLAFSNGIPFPTMDPVRYEPSFYNDVVNRLDQDLDGLSFVDAAFVNSLLSVLEGYWSYIPSSTNLKEISDISLYDHAKITAAVAGATLQYLQSKNRYNFKKELLDNEESFRKEDAFLLVKLDISGIQNFIYTTSSSDALKNLRARSLYLELFTEHICDLLLEACGLSRANLIYSGGGQALLVLANTTETAETLEIMRINIKKWCIKQYGTELAVFLAETSCTAEQFMTSTENHYGKLTQELEKQIHKNKLRRYNATDLLQLNQRSPGDLERECGVCHRVDMLTQDEDGLDICTLCVHLRSFSREVVKKDRYFLVLNKPPEKAPTLPLPNSKGENVYVTILSERQTKEYTADRTNLLRIYSKNKPSSGVFLATNLWMGDAFFPAPNAHTEQMSSFEDLAQQSEGINRIAALRADVDNLGQVFIEGFRSYAETNDQKVVYTTLSRVATLSRSLSLFFKYYINLILSSPADHLPFTPHTFHEKPVMKTRKANIIYSGGDDMFIVGSWDDLLLTALDLREAFSYFNGDTLTFSAGYGLYHAHFPLIQIAYDTGSLEDQAKSVDQKNALALFSHKIGDMHTYGWSNFTTHVLKEKLNFLLATLDHGAQSTLTYKILQLLCTEENNSTEKATGPINIARLAYLLARHQKSNRLSSGFSTTMYQWALNPKDRNELITALYLYHYLKRSN